MSYDTAAHRAFTERSPKPCSTPSFKLELGDRIGLLVSGRLEELLPASEFRQAGSAEASAFLECLNGD